MCKDNKGRSRNLSLVAMKGILITFKGGKLNFTVIKRKSSVTPMQPIDNNRSLNLRL